MKIFLNHDLTILDCATIMAGNGMRKGVFTLNSPETAYIILDSENDSDENEKRMSVREPKKENASAKADIVLHPIRFRILMIASGRRVTAQHIIAALPDVPQASAYRHIARLVEAGILETIEETTPRGTIEKTFTLPEQAADLSRSEMAPVTSEDHMRYFTGFTTLMLSQFRAYIDRKEQGELTGEKEGGWYWSEAVHLTDGEYDHFVKALKAIEGLAAAHQPGPERRRRLIFTAIIPDVGDM